DLATLAWTRMDPANGPQPLGANLANISDYDPSTRKVYLFDRDNFYSYTPDSNTYERLGEAHVLLYAMGTIDPKRKLFFVLGPNMGGQGPNNNGTPSMFVVNIAPGSDYAFEEWTSMLTGCDDFIGASGDYAGLAYDPTRDRIVGWINGGDTNRVFLFNPDT